LEQTVPTIVCARCKKTAEPPAARRIGFPAAVKEQLLSSICAECWQEWEGMEVKVINEYRLNFLDPQHREMLQKACFDFLGLPPA
jgi:Fe-S cluster biosynthesis and repair protein YggX